MLVGLTLTALGFSSAADKMSDGAAKFMQASGPIFLCIGIVSLIAGYIIFSIGYGRHMGGNKKDDHVPQPDRATDMAQWGNRQKHPQRNEQAAMLFQAKGSTTQTSTQQAATTTAFDKVSSNKANEAPEAGMFLAEGVRESSKKLLEETKPNSKNKDTGYLNNLPTVGQRNGKLPPLNPTLPDTTRDSVRNSSKKRKAKGDDDYVWKDEDFDPMPTAPKDLSVFTVGGKSQTNSGQRKVKREREGEY